SVVVVPSPPIELGDDETLVLRIDQFEGTRATFGDVGFRVSSDVRATMTAELDRIFGLAPEVRTDEERTALRTHYARIHAEPEIPELAQRIASLETRALELETAPDTRIMRDDDSGRRTRVLARGDFLQPGEEVSCGAPETLQLDGPVTVRDRLEL